MKNMQKRRIGRVVCTMIAAICMGSAIASAAMSDHFVTTRKTDHEGVSNDSSITIPVHPDYIYNYSVDRNNDGTMDQTGITGAVTHDFGKPGTYTVRITGTYPAIYFGINGEKSIV